jgi:uncharacterized Tic20 family protein
MNEFENVTAPPPPPVGAVTAEERQWGLIAHLSALAGLIIPFGNVLGPLVVWLIKKDQLSFAADQAKEALNFHITVALAGIVCAVLMLVFIGFLLLPLLGLFALVFTIVAAVKVSNGEAYRYPFTLRLIK